MSKSNYIFFSFVLVVTLTLFSCAKDKARPDTESCTPVSFSQQVVPIINQACISCHYAGSASGDLSDYSGVKAKADNGSLKQRVIVQKDMPGITALTAAEIQKIRCWIEQGAQDN